MGRNAIGKPRRANVLRLLREARATFAGVPYGGKTSKGRSTAKDVEAAVAELNGFTVSSEEVTDMMDEIVTGFAGTEALLRLQREPEQTRVLQLILDAIAVVFELRPSHARECWDSLSPRAQATLKSTAALHLNSI